MKYKYGDFFFYNCHQAWWSVCYSVTSTEMSFTPRSKKRLETSKHSLNADSDIFLFEWMEGWTKKQDQTSNCDEHQIIRQISIRSKQKHTLYTTRRAWRHTFTKSDRRLKGLSTDVNECWPCRVCTTFKIHHAELKNALRALVVIVA